MNLEEKGKMEREYSESFLYKILDKKSLGILDSREHVVRHSRILKRARAEIKNALEQGFQVLIIITNKETGIEETIS